MDLAFLVTSPPVTYNHGENAEDVLLEGCITGMYTACYRIEGVAAVYKP
jgi:hypothetical protein